jgi:TFIIF-interacting CTD phosphatase-like protein
VFQGPAGDCYRQHEHRPTAPLHSADSLHVTLSDNETVTVNRRPGLTEFLTALSTEFHVVVFTAGREVYACKVLDAIDPKVS